MRFLLIAGTVIVALLGYTGLWFFTAERLERGIEHWAASERAKGSIVNYESLKITGFPYRMRAELTDVAIARPTKAGMAMVGTRTLVIDSYPHKINHLIFDFPAPIHYDRPLGDKPHNQDWREQTELNFEEAHASVVLTLEGARASFEGKGLSARARFSQHGAEPGPYAPLLNATSVAGHLRPAPDRDDVTEGFMQALAVQFARKNPRTGTIPPALERFQSTFFGTHSGSVLRSLQSGATPEATIKAWAKQGGTLEIDRVFAKVENLEVTASGDLVVDEAGFPRGPLSFKAVGWRESAVLVNPDGRRTRQQQDMARGIFELLDQLDGKLDGTMQTKLELHKGGAWLGPFRLLELEKVW